MNAFSDVLAHRCPPPCGAEASSWRPARHLWVLGTNNPSAARPKNVSLLCGLSSRLCEVRDGLQIPPLMYLNFSPPPFIMSVLLKNSPRARRYSPNCSRIWNFCLSPCVYIRGPIISRHRSEGRNRAAPRQVKSPLTRRSPSLHYAVLPLLLGVVGRVPSDHCALGQAGGVGCPGVDQACLLVRRARDAGKPPPCFPE